MPSPQTEVTRTDGYGYLLFLPRQYKDSERWPLILFLHGAGERGSTLEHLKRNGLPQEIETQEDFPFIVISPQCPEAQYWSTALLSALLNEVVAEYKVDPDRIYLTGISMGAYGAWQMAIEYPQRFAAIAPICGGGNPQDVSRIKHLPVWAFHGAMDDIIPIAESEIMIEALKACRGDVRFTIYPDAAHDSWTQTYKNPALYEWLMEHRRQSGARTEDVP